jgi:pimeloyl-ACP methyl ester carboxylesterase
MIDAVDPGIKLYVRNKRPEDMRQFTSEKTLLFVHGATLPSEVTFGFPLDGLSWMDYIARQGWDVYLVEVRGYGRSTRPPEMDQPAARRGHAFRHAGEEPDAAFQRGATLPR